LVVVSLAVTAALTGCASSPVDDGSDGARARRHRPADEAAQAERNAVDTLRSYCVERAPRPGRRDAAHAVTLLLRHARREIRRTDPDPETNLTWRDNLAWLSGALKRADCLPQGTRYIKSRNWMKTTEGLYSLRKTMRPVLW